MFYGCRGHGNGRFEGEEWVRLERSEGILGNVKPPAFQFKARFLRNFPRNHKFAALDVGPLMSVYWGGRRVGGRERGGVERVLHGFSERIGGKEDPGEEVSSVMDGILSILEGMDARFAGGATVEPAEE